jgi:5-dehydro-2-deoxygluconokinase
VDVWVLGRIAYDLFATEIGKPLPECASFTRHVGGSSANIAVGLARQGLKVGMISSVGDDLFADYFDSFLGTEGVDTRFVKRAKGYGTQLCVGEVRPPFRQVFYRHKPADTQLAIGQDALAAVASARMFVTNGTSLSAEPSRRSTLEALAAAKAAKVPTVFDVDYRESSWSSADEAGSHARAALADIDVVIANEEEVGVLTGESDPAQAVDKVLASGPTLLVRKLGAAGVQAHTRDGSVKVPPMPVEVVSTVGAGDGFAAGFLAAWLEKRDLPDCLRRGNAAAAIVVGKVSCSDVMPTAEELEKLVRS